MSRIHLDAAAGPREADTQDVPVSELRLDPENVRFFHIKDRLLTDSEMDELIWKEPASKALLRSILASGGLSNPPIITKGKTTKEGNRRLVALRRARLM